MAVKKPKKPKNITQKTKRYTTKSTGKKSTGQGSARRNTGGAGSLTDLVVRTINGIKVPLNTGSSDKKKKKK
jgi:hypothetical protein